jgi:hypothetical protein
MAVSPSRSSMISAGKRQSDDENDLTVRCQRAGREIEIAGRMDVICGVFLR